MAKSKAKTHKTTIPKFQCPEQLTVKGVTLNKITLEQLTNLKKASSRYGWRITQLTEPLLIPLPIEIDGSANLEMELNRNPLYFSVLQKANSYLPGKPGYSIHSASGSKTHQEVLVSKLYVPIILYNISKR